MKSKSERSSSVNSTNNVMAIKDVRKIGECQTKLAKKWETVCEQASQKIYLNENTVIIQNRE